MKNDDLIETGASASLVTPKLLAVGGALALAALATACRPDTTVGLDNGTVGGSVDIVH